MRATVDEKSFKFGLKRNLNHKEFKKEYNRLQKQWDAEYKNYWLCEHWYIDCLLLLASKRGE